MIIIEHSEVREDMHLARRDVDSVRFTLNGKEDIVPVAHSY